MTNTDHADGTEQPGTMASTRVRRMLEAIDREQRGWDSRAGGELFELIRDVVASQERRFRHAAGDLGGAAIADVWQALEAWRSSDRTTEPAAILYKQAQRRTAVAAAAAQTGVGSPSTSGLVAVARSVRLLSLDDVNHPSDIQESDAFAAPTWMRMLGVMLVQHGWPWSVAPVLALAAAAESATHSGRRKRSPLAVFDALGIPAATWTALELLTVGSGPGCRPELSWPGAYALARRGGLQAVRASSEVQRIVAAAVAGTPIRTGREFRSVAS